MKKKTEKTKKVTSLMFSCSTLAYNKITRIIEKTHQYGSDQAKCKSDFWPLWYKHNYTVSQKKRHRFIFVIT